MYYFETHNITGVFIEHVQLVSHDRLKRTTQKLFHDVFFWNIICPL